MIANQPLNYLRINLILMLFININTLFAQSDTGKHKNLQLNMGISAVSVKDYSLSPLLYQGTGLRVGTTYEWGKTRRRNNLLSLNYRGGALSNEVTAFSVLTINHAQLQYRHLRSVGNSGLQVGGSSSLFVLFKTNEYIDSNIISYDMGANAGITLAYGSRRLFNDKWKLSLGLNLPVVAYYIRPVYGTPYPSEFLTEENFIATLEVGPILSNLPSSGEVVFWDTYFELSTSVQAVRSLTDMFDELRLGYQWNYLQFKSLESSHYAEQLFSVSLVKYLTPRTTHEK